MVSYLVAFTAVFISHLNLHAPVYRGLAALGTRLSPYVYMFIILNKHFEGSCELLSLNLTLILTSSIGVSVVGRGASVGPSLVIAGRSLATALASICSDTDC